MFVQMTDAQIFDYAEKLKEHNRTVGIKEFANRVYGDAVHTVYVSYDRYGHVQRVMGLDRKQGSIQEQPRAEMIKQFIKDHLDEGVVGPDYLVGSTFHQAIDELYVKLFDGEAVEQLQPIVIQAITGLVGQILGRSEEHRGDTEYIVLEDLEECHPGFDLYKKDTE